MGTLDKASAVHSKLKAYLGNKDLLFDEMTVAFLRRYESYLADELGNTVNTIHSNLKIFRKLVNDAIQEGLDGINRIREIVLSLRNFSRLDEPELKEADLNEGLHSTIRLIRPLCKEPLTLMA